MKVTLVEPYAEARGVLACKGEYYVRMLNGKPIIQRRPKRTKPPTEKQLKARKMFKKMAGNGWRNVKGGNRMVTEW